MRLRDHAFSPDCCLNLVLGAGGMRLKARAVKAISRPMVRSLGVRRRCWRQKVAINTWSFSLPGTACPSRWSLPENRDEKPHRHGTRDEHQTRRNGGYSPTGMTVENTIAKRWGYCSWRSSCELELSQQRLERSCLARRGLFVRT